MGVARNAYNGGRRHLPRELARALRDRRWLLESIADRAVCPADGSSREALVQLYETIYLVFQGRGLVLSAGFGALESLRTPQDIKITL